jgi:protein-S-isoprenylcysteine O-methyltransferase Ste14
VQHGLLTLIRVSAFIATVTLWRWALQRSFSPGGNLLCLVGSVLAVFPVVWIGRRLLDRRPTPERVAWVTTGVHGVLMVLFGVAIVKAIQTADAWRALVLPVPRPLGLILVVVTGLLTLLTVLNLAVRGLGAPFAIALSRRLATDWLYGRTRNPMVLATLAWLVAVGLLLQSAAFVLWAVGLVAPAWIAFLKVYEERELEIRFGSAYLAYKEKTPFLWPRAPLRRAESVRGYVGR